MKLVKRLGFLSFLVLALFINSCVTTRGEMKNDEQKQPYDVIIIPGMPFYRDWSDNEMKSRVIWSYYLYSQGIAKNIIYSGSAVYSPYIESLIMAKYGEALGIPSANILCETNAQHSTENLVYSLRIANRMGFKKIAVASGGFQIAFLKMFAWNNNIKVDFIPFNLPEVEKLVSEEKKITIDPTDAYVENFVPLPEKENFFVRMKGTMGYNIK